MSEEIKYEVYSPASVIGIFNNALKLPVTVNLIYLKGRYSYGMGKAYSNYYYDHLYSESDNSSIGVKDKKTKPKKQDQQRDNGGDDMPPM